MVSWSFYHENEFCFHFKNLPLSYQTRWKERQEIRCISLCSGFEHSNLGKIKVNAQNFYTREASVEGTVVYVWLTQRELVFKFQMRETNDNLFENGILFIRSIRRLFFHFCVIALDSNGCSTWRFVVSDALYSVFKKSYVWRSQLCNYSSSFCLNILKLKYNGKLVFSWKSGSWNAAVYQNTNFHTIGAVTVVTRIVTENVVLSSCTGSQEPIQKTQQMFNS